MLFSGRAASLSGWRASCLRRILIHFSSLRYFKNIKVNPGRIAIWIYSTELSSGILHCSPFPRLDLKPGLRCALSHKRPEGELVTSVTCCAFVHTFRPAADRYLGASVRSEIEN